MQEKTLTIRFAEELHRKIKTLAAKEGKTIKECILKGLDAAFPSWREDKK